MTNKCMLLGLLGLGLVLAACEGGDEGEGEDGPGLQGRLIDANEQPLPDVQVLACQATTCYYGQSDADGRFSFVIEPPADVALKTHANLASVPRMAAALVPVDIVDASLVELGDVYVPELPDGVVLGPPSDELQTCLVGDGLELSLRSADLTVGIGEFLYDLAARRLPPEHVQVDAELDGCTRSRRPAARRSACVCPWRFPMARASSCARSVTSMATSRRWSAPSSRMATP
jgi:hypothetical protein